MPNNCLSVLNKVENKNVGLKVGGTNIPLPPNQKRGGHMPTPPPLPPLRTPVLGYMPKSRYSVVVAKLKGEFKVPAGERT